MKTDKNEGGLRVQGKTKRGTGEKPLVSVITVVHNIAEQGREQYFRKMMDSVNRQDYGYGSIEHIIIDGASTDSTLDLINEYVESKQVDYWLSEKDTGVYQAMNRGVKHSSGQYVNFMNSDDYFAPHAISRSIEKILDAGADYSYASADIIDEGSKFLFTREPHFLEFVYFVIPFCHQTMFVKREWFEKIGLFDESLNISGDWDFVMRLHLAGAFAVRIDEVLVYFRSQGISEGILDNPGYHYERRKVKEKNYFNQLDLNEEDLYYLETFLRNPLIGSLDKARLLNISMKLASNKDLAFDLYLLLVRNLFINKIDVTGIEIPFNSYFKPVGVSDETRSARRLYQKIVKRIFG